MCTKCNIVIKEEAVNIVTTRSKQQPRRCNKMDLVPMDLMLNIVVKRQVSKNTLHIKMTLNQK